MSRIATVFAIVLLCSSAVLAQGPRFMPEAGKLMGFASHDVPCGWVVLALPAIDPIEPVILDSGRMMYWQGGAGDYLVQCFVEGTLQPITRKVTLGGSGPTPPPPVVIPDDKFGLTAKSLQWGGAVAVAHRGKAADLASNFEATYAALAAGGIATPADAVRELTGKNRQTLGNDGDPPLEAWRPFFVSWQQAVDGLIAAGTVKTTAEDYVELFRETAAGLRQVK